MSSGWHLSDWNLTDWHLCDEAVAAFADGVLSAVPRLRAQHHIDSCAECAQAVAGQREAARAVRCTVVPGPSADFLARLRAVPSTATVEGPGPTTGLGTAGEPVFAAFGTRSILQTADIAAPRATSGSRNLLRHGALLGVAAAAITFGASVAVVENGAAGQQSTQQTPTTGTTAVVGTVPSVQPLVAVVRAAGTGVQFGR